RKTGSPTWAGKLWWKRQSDSGWDDSRSVALQEPDYDSKGIGQVLVDVPWDGLIEQIKIASAANQTSSDYYEYDWIAIGRPSPGASLAALHDVSVRVTQNEGVISEQGQAITGLQGDVNQNTGDIEGHTSAIQGLQTSIQSAENSIDSNS